MRSNYTPAESSAALLRKINLQKFVAQHADVLRDALQAIQPDPRATHALADLDVLAPRTAAAL